MNQTTPAPEPSSLAGRAMLAMALLIGFYLLALSIIGVLLYIPYAEFIYLGRLHIKLAFFCLFGASLVFSGIFPRRTKFVAPGPLLTEHDHPRLFEEIRNIARITHQEMPAEVYLLVEPNAWVMDRKNFLGIGSTRAMGIGLPLLQLLTVDQLRGVLAHEFGHFHSGDTKLGPWIYKTRALLEQTLQTLGKHSSVLQRPFIWYGNAFLRITHSISRQQEYTADALAATLVGPAPLISGLKVITSAGPAFNGYWQTEVTHVLDRGYRPPIAEGFSMYVNVPAISTAFTQYSEDELTGKKANPYDTHPSLSERVAALQRFPEKQSGHSNDVAITLIDNIGELEGKLLGAVAGNKAAGKLKFLTWAETADKVWVPLWRERLQEIRQSIAGVTPQMLPEVIGDTKRFSPLLRKSDGKWVPEEYHKQYLGEVFASVIALALIEAGWKPYAMPGEEIMLRKGDRTVAPFSRIAMIIADKGTEAKMSAEEWRAFCKDLDIAEMDLGK